ncbi:helix-turn-helix transcriptional regulator [Glycomyces tenuis]|uniref:helix-turn-helix transcriptional regulator n=2 Tax=Glycomyces tenuis TaxID=58116 RepID=UPI0003F5F132|nr:WYL domain-containing protein [Glycomyces tenuis]
MADVTGRALSLLAMLQTGRSFSGEELAERLGVSPRTLRRDVDRLRGYGYPVATRPGPGGHYRLTAGTAMPPLMLGDDEAIAVLLGLAALAATGSAAEGSLDDAATRAYGKVEQYLPKRLRHRAARLRASLETEAPPAPSTGAADLGTLAEAIGQRRAVAFDYERKDGAVSRRRVEPHRQVHRHLRWYLLGWDTGRGDWRLYRVDRIGGLTMTNDVFAPRPLPAATAVDYLDQGINRGRERVVLTVEAPAAAVADAFRYEDVELHPLGERRTRATLMLDTWEWLLTGLAFLDAEVTVEEPPAFRAALAAFGVRLSGER